MSVWIDWPAFTPVSALLGGAFIGAAAALLVLGTGRVLGMSGILQNALTKAIRLPWQVSFVVGMALLTWVYALLVGFPEFVIERSYAWIVVAGLLVGFGTRLGSGCTSGHGVCGLSRWSGRSLVATLTFMACGIVSASLMNLWI